MNRSFWQAAATALIITLAMPVPADALDLGKTIRKVTKSVSSGLSGTGGGNTGSSSSSSSPSGGATGSGPSASASISKKGGVKLDVGTGLLGGTNLAVGTLAEDSIAGAQVSVGNAKVGASVLSKGQLASLGLDANPRGTSNAGLPNGSVAGVTPDYARRLVGGLDRNERQMLQIKCGNVLRSPKAFDAELILLCRLVASL